MLARTNHPVATPIADIRPNRIMATVYRCERNQMARSTSNMAGMRFLLPLTFLLAAPGMLCAQQGFGPLDPAPPDGHTVAEIIQRFGERETAFQHARDSYTYRRSVKIDVLDNDTGKVAGEHQEVTDIVFNSAGEPAEHVVFAPADTLGNAGVTMSPTDQEEIEHRLPFILTTADQPLYNISYAGRQKVDELDTYVFNVAPKQMVKGKHYFQGKVWVDQQDLEIVMVNGQTVPQDLRLGKEDLQPPFTTYYEQVDGKYWFPTYTKAEAVLHFPAYQDRPEQDVHLRSVVKYTDYKQFHATSRIIYDGQDITDQKPPDAQPPAQKK